MLKLISEEVHVREADRIRVREPESKPSNFSTLLLHVWTWVGRGQKYVIVSVLAHASLYQQNLISGWNVNYKEGQICSISCQNWEIRYPVQTLNIFADQPPYTKFENTLRCIYENGWGKKDMTLEVMHLEETSFSTSPAVRHGWLGSDRVSGVL